MRVNDVIFALIQCRYLDNIFRRLVGNYEGIEVEVSAVERRGYGGVLLDIW